MNCDFTGLVVTNAIMFGKNKLLKSRIEVVIMVVDMVKV